MGEGKIQPGNLMHRHFAKSRSLALLGMTIKADPSTTWPLILRGKPAPKNRAQEKAGRSGRDDNIGCFGMSLLDEEGFAELVAADKGFHGAIAKEKILDFAILEDFLRGT